MAIPAILTFSEQPKNGLELLSPARELGGQLGAEVHSIASECEPEEMIARGSSVVYRTERPTGNIDPDYLLSILSASARIAEPVAILLSGTRNGKDLAGRLAVRLNVACVSDVLSLKLLSDGSILLERLVWGGNGIASIIPRTRPFIVTIPPQRFPVPEPDGSAQGKVIDTAVPPRSGRLTFSSVSRKLGDKIDLHSASVIVGVGRGFRRPEDLKLGEKLAAALGGILCGSRPLTSDLKWLPEDRQLGLSGTTVSPKLYVAVGISGQIQHLVGIRDSKTILAINSDKSAPIFEECDYGIVGDLYAIIPALIEELQKRKS